MQTLPKSVKCVPKFPTVRNDIIITHERHMIKVNQIKYENRKVVIFFIEYSIVQMKSEMKFASNIVYKKTLLTGSYINLYLVTDEGTGHWPTPKLKFDFLFLFQ